MQIVFDTETNGLLRQVSLLHCGAVSVDFAEPELFTNPKKLLRKLDQADELIGHNIIAYDLMVLWQLYRWKPRAGVKITDTMVLSMMSQPDIFGGHSLAAWGERTGEYKTNYLEEYKAWKLSLDPEWKYTQGEEWVAFNPVMGSYCQQDVRATCRTYHRLRKDMAEMVREDARQRPKAQRVSWDDAEWMEMEFAKIFARQAWRGVYIDKEHCEQMVAAIDAEMAALEAEVEPQLPEREGNKGQLDSARPPKQCFKKDGKPNANTEKWFDALQYTAPDGCRSDFGGRVHEVQKQHGDRAEGWFGLKYGTWHTLPTPMENEFERAPLRTMFPMRMSDQPEIKGWLMSLGWIPTMWNYKKAPDKHGKLRPVRDDNGDLVVTHPKFHDKGELCKNLEDLIVEGTLPPIAKQCVRWIIIRHRRGLFAGLLENLRPDGTVPATGFSCGTPTTRVTHSVVANVPKADDAVVLGKECRKAFRARPGRKLSGTDASGLELRCLAARVNSDFIREMIVNGKKEDRTEIHTYLFDQCKPLSPSRSAQKSINYGWLYGASDKKLGLTAGHPDAKAEQVGAEIRRRLVAAIPGLEKLIGVDGKSGAMGEAAKRGYIRGLDGRMIGIRSKHAALNTLLQSDGSILVKWATVYQNHRAIEERLDAYQVIHYHDEVQWDCHPAHAKRAGELFIEGLKWAGKKFNYACPLDGENQIGLTWADCH